MSMAMAMARGGACARLLHYQSAPSCASSGLQVASVDKGA